MPANRINRCFLLYVEDEDATAYLFQAALRKTGVMPQFFRATDGEHATNFLLRHGAFSDAPRPDLVLLDLNLPRKSGLDVLAEIKSNPRLRDIVVVVFSTSAQLYDRERSLELGADEYVGKGDSFDSFVKVAESIRQRLTVGR